MADQPALITAAAANENYGRLCSQIGQLVVRRDDLYDQVDAVDRDIRAAKVELAKAIGQYDALAHNARLEASVLQSAFPGSKTAPPVALVSPLVQGDADVD